MSAAAVMAQSTPISISVIIPAHDDGVLVCQAVQSVARALKTHWSNLESAQIVISLDNPSSDTVAAAHTAADSVSAIQIVITRNTGAPGPAGARNAGISAATGEWVGFLDADDLWREEAPTALVQCLRDYPQACWVGGDFVKIDNDGTQISQTGEFKSRPGTYRALQPAFDKNQVTSFPTPISQFLNVITCWTGATFVKKATLISEGCFNESLWRGEDIHLWYRLALSNDFYFVPKVLTEYRQRTSTITRRGQSPGQAERQSLLDLIQQKRFAPVKQLIVQRYIRAALSDCLYFRSCQEWTKGLAIASEALHLSPLDSRLWRQLFALALRRPN